MNYGDLIKDAFWITLRNRYLWFFGFFAGGGLNFPFGFGRNFNMENQRQASAAPMFAVQQTASNNVALIIALVALGLLIFVVFVVLSVISQGALAESVAAIDRGERRGFSSAWRAGTANFWRVLGQILLFILIGLGLFLAIGILVAALVLGASAVTAQGVLQTLLIVIAGLIAVGLLIVVFIPLTIISQLALRELVLSREGVFASIGGGYHLFRRNLGRSLLVWLIQLVVVIAAAIALFIALSLIGLVLFIPAIILAVTGYSTAAIIAGVVAGLILLPIFLVVLAILGTFNHSYWTLAYLRLATSTSEVAPQPV